MTRQPFVYSAVAALLLSACTKPQFSSEAVEPESTAPPVQTQVQASAPFDLSAVMRQVHFAYRPDGDGWSAGHSTYEVRVDAGGLELRPFHYDRESREALESLRRWRERPNEGEAASIAELPKPLEGAPLKLASAEIRRGKRLLSTGAARAEQQQDGSLELVRENGTERLVNGEEGVEQSWAFPERPAGDGDLLVSVGVSGLEYAAATSTGLHFRDARTGLGFRYGHGTWIDANGERTHVEAVFEHGAIVLRVPGEVVERSAFPAVLDPVISPERGVDAPVLGPSHVVQRFPAVATNGTDYFVVWEDHRKGAGILGTRVSASGVVLDTTGIELARGLFLAPSVARSLLK